MATTELKGPVVGSETGAVYRGRFAPTPSGPLHLGSLLTAVAGFLQARSAGGAWLLRIDDLDVQRSRDDAADTILRQLEAHGLEWDETVRKQSSCVAEYESAYGLLHRKTRLYGCICTRARLALESTAGPDGPVYAGTCRDRNEEFPGASVRLEVGEGQLALIDPWQETIKRDIAHEIGDFVLRRSDGQIGYQLACVVDEAAQRITEVVRGSDLIGSSMRQVHLQRMLDLPPPRYRHLPVLLDERGHKLSKQNHAAPIEGRGAVNNLGQCLRLLGQAPPPDCAAGGAREVLNWAIAHWQPETIPRVRTFAAPIDAP